MKLLKQVVVFFLLLFLLSSLLRNILSYHDKIRFYQDFKNNYDQEKKENISLQTEILKKKSYSELEKTIRDKLNLLQPGEIAITIPTPTPGISTITPTPAPNWQQWWNVFFNHT